MVASIRWRNALSLFVDFGNESQNISSMYVVLGNLELQWEPSRNFTTRGRPTAFHLLGAQPVPLFQANGT